MTTFWDVSFAVDMITKVESKAPVWASEFMDLVKAITTFRDYFNEIRYKYGIPSNLLDELNYYISLLPSEDKPLKYLDVVRAEDQNNLVEALRVIGQIIPYVEVRLYKQNIYVSPTCWGYYISFYSGYGDNKKYGITQSAFNVSTWMHYTLDRSGRPPTMSCLEVWFNVNKQYPKAKIHIKADIARGKPDQPNISIYFLSSGAPLTEPTIPFVGMLCVRDRTDVSIAGQFDLIYQSGVYTYDITETINVGAFIPYIVVACHDAWLDQQVLMYIRELYITPQE